MKTRFRQLIYLTCFCLISLSVFPQKNNLGEQIKQAVSGKAATIGVAAIFDGKELVTINNLYRFPLMNSFQLHQAMAVMNHLNKKNKTIDTEITVKHSQLSDGTHSPMRDNNPTGNFRISIADLLKYSLIDGDNNASDVLFNYLGGPQHVEKYIHELGIQDLAISQTEAMMLKDPDNIMLNWTKPSAAVLLLETFLQQPVCNKGQKLFIEKALTKTTIGENKLKAGLPEDVLLAHKASSSNRNEYDYKIADNDMGIVILPNGQYYTIAVFVMNSRESDENNAKIIADVSKVVYDYFVQNYKK